MTDIITRNVTTENITNKIIKDVAAGKIEPFINDDAIAANSELAHQLQGRLKQFWLLKDVDGEHYKTLNLSVVLKKKV